jgi:hypothetical protein
MADKDIIQSLIAELGQSQGERLPPELDAHFADVDERSTEALWEWTQRLAGLVSYYAGAADAPAGDWKPLFPDTGPSLRGYLERADGRVPAHLALLLAFLELYRIPQGLANQLTGRHLDFYYRDVLRLRKRGPEPDHAHVLVELKKGATSVALGPEELLTAGKDEAGVELVYAPVRDTVVGPGRVESLRSVYLDREGRGTVRFAPIASSSDGLGGKLPADEPKWRAFGHPGLPRAEIGFALSSPVLRMREGERKGTLRLRLSGVDAAGLDTASFAGAFSVYLTGEKSWIEPSSVSVGLGGDGVLQVDFALPASAQAVVDYQQAVHGYAYAATAPVVQLLLSGATGAVGYLDFAELVLVSASVAVEVSGATTLALESDAGALDPKKAFQPFGAQPTAGSRFMVAYPEALAKKLSELKLTLRWKDVPASLGDLYKDYGAGEAGNDSFTARVSFRDGGGTEFDASAVTLFRSADARAECDLTFRPGSAPPQAAGGGESIRALSAAGSDWSMREAHRHVMARPVRASWLLAAPVRREGFVTLSLNRGFLHAEYRRKYVENVLAFTKAGSGTPVILKEPYTPMLQGIFLAYKAYSDEVPISSAALADFANPDVQFFHLAPFGPRREHGYQRQRLPFLAGSDVRLLPSFRDAGELLVGLSHLGAGDGVSLLFQVAAGSADPELPPETVGWSVLCDDHWRPLGPDELVLDTTDHLRASGIVKLTIPPEATTANTLLPAGLLWIRAAVPGKVEAVSQLIEVAANALEVRLVDQGNDPRHLESALPRGSIVKLKGDVAAVKGVAQPYASYGGRPAEDDSGFRTRVAERLRHKNRCITPWDYERVVLEAFPGLHKVKCIPHAKPGSWMAPGNVLLVVIPDLRNRNAVDPLRPRADADTLDRVGAHVRARAGMQVRVAVKNPTYQKIRLDFKVRFRPGYDFNHYRDELQRTLLRALSPWAFEAEREISFGGAVYRSVLLNLVEELPYVDYLTDFRMYSFAGELAATSDLSVARPATPDAILVSDASHGITQAP